MDSVEDGIMGYSKKSLTVVSESPSEILPTVPSYKQELEAQESGKNRFVRKPFAI